MIVGWVAVIAALGSTLVKAQDAGGTIPGAATSTRYGSAPLSNRAQGTRYAATAPAVPFLADLLTVLRRSYLPRSFCRLACSRPPS
jgi:hypothetical protein